MDASATADKVIEFTLRHVPFDGWSVNAMRRGAVDAGVDLDKAIEMFGDNPLNLIQYYSEMLDRKMRESVSGIDLTQMKIRDRVATCVMERIKIMGPYREASQKAATILSMPSNVPLASKLMFKTVDQIWYLAGDQATDFNYYTKRGLLSIVYSSTMLYWFRDMSSEFSSTKSFLERRIDNVMKIPKLKGQISNGINTLKGFFFK